MQPNSSISRKNGRAAHRLSRRGVLTAALVALVGLALALVGCSADQDPAESVDGKTAVVANGSKLQTPLWNDEKAIRIMGRNEDAIT